MKIVRFEASNIKKLVAVEITPDGNIVQITGRNGSGKSSILDAIYWALAGTRGIDSEPIRRGANSATIRLDLGEVIVTRKFTGSGNTSLIVEAANGARFPSPQRMLDELLGALTFDPLEFARMEPRKQLDTLRGLVKLDIDIDAIDAENAKDYEVRTEANRRAKDLAARAAAITVSDNLPAEPVDESALLAEIENAAQRNLEITREGDRRAAARERLSRMALGLAAKRAEVERLQREIEDREADIKREESALAEAAPLPALVDTAAVREAFNRARFTNAKIRQRNERDRLLSQQKDAEEIAAALTSSIEARNGIRQRAIAAAAMPVPGLSFGDGEVLFTGIPFSQASSAEQLRVSVAIAMAANPKLRVLRIKDGSLLDEESLSLIAEMAKSEDYQVWMERVDTSGRVGIVMEEGEVVAVNGSGAEAADLPAAV